MAFEPEAREFVDVELTDQFKKMIEYLKSKDETKHYAASAIYFSLSNISKAAIATKLNRWPCASCGDHYNFSYEHCTNEKCKNGLGTRVNCIFHFENVI